VHAWDPNVCKRRMKKGRFPMGATDSPVITCPVCGAQGAMLHHDVRASLIYA
jgi:hypothetical protein